MFTRLKAHNPRQLSKIIPLTGDLNTERLGLSDSDLNILTENVNVIFHCAATLKLEATLKDAVEQNTAGTARVIDVAKKVKNLLAFVHFSTAFCSADLEVFEERVSVFFLGGFNESGDIWGVKLGKKRQNCQMLYI